MIMPNTNQNKGFSQSSMLLIQKQEYELSTQKIVEKTTEEPVTLVSSNPAGLSMPPTVGGLIPLLMYGGIAVAVIIAMAYFSQIQLKAMAHFSQIQLKSITELIKVSSKKTK